MKHVFLRKVYEKKYFLGYQIQTQYSSYEYKMNWNSEEEDDFENFKTVKRRCHTGSVYYKNKFKENEIISETNTLLRELNIGESFWFNDKEHVVERKSYGELGEVVYILKTERIVDDQDSLLEAKSDLEKRRQFLKEKKEAILDKPVYPKVDNRSWLRKFIYPNEEI